MITADTFATIEKDIKSKIDGVNVKSSITGLGIHVAFTIKSLDRESVIDLATIATDHKLDLDVKRSGTGLSVHFS